MKIQFLSDLHLEFTQNERFFKANPITKEADILIMAGDIMKLNSINEGFLDDISKKFDMVYWIPGNHEYYDYMMQQDVALETKMRNNVILLDNKSVLIDNTKFIFSTFWSKINEQYRYSIYMGLNDFKKINKGWFNVDQFNHQHDVSLDFVSKELMSDDLNKVVVTHHVPTYLNRDKRYNDVLDSAFYSEQFNLIHDYKPLYWIYGHNHYNIEPFKINETTLLTNQCGYIDQTPDYYFSPTKTFEI